MSKSQYTAECKISIVKKYLSGEASCANLASTYKVGETTIRHWIGNYRAQGEAGFSGTAGNSHYSKEFKTMCVKAVMNGEGSVDDIVAKNNIFSRSVLNSWIMKYNANMELKDYEPKREDQYSDPRVRHKIFCLFPWST